MAQVAPSLEDYLKLLDSMDAKDRLEGIEALRRYASHRKVTQAVFDLRNDPDRAVRTAARELLEEADRRTSESLSLPGAESKERDLYLNELLAALAAADPTDRVTALKELRQLDDPRALEAVEKCKRDSNRVVRMLAEEASKARLEAAERPKTTTWEGNVMTSSPVSERQKKDWREVKASRLGPELVPWIGLAYLALGLPLAVMTFYLWVDRQGVFADLQLAAPAVVESGKDLVLRVDVRSTFAGPVEAQFDFELEQGRGAPRTYSEKVVLPPCPGVRTMHFPVPVPSAEDKCAAASASGTLAALKLANPAANPVRVSGRVAPIPPAKLGLIDSKFAPRPFHYEIMRDRFGIPIDPLTLAVAFAVAAFQTIGGFGMMLRLDGGRKAILLFHAMFFIFGMLLPGTISKFLPGIVSVIIVYYLTRPQIIATFKGAKKNVEPTDKPNYGDMERKVW